MQDALRLRRLVIVPLILTKEQRREYVRFKEDDEGNLLQKQKTQTNTFYLSYYTALFVVFIFLYILFCSLQTFTSGLQTKIKVYRPVKVVQTYKAFVKRGFRDSSYSQRTTTFLGGDVCGRILQSPIKSYSLSKVELGRVS